MVSYSIAPSAVATRVPAGMVISPAVLRARVKRSSPLLRPARTRRMPSSPTTWSSAPPLAVSRKPARYTVSICAYSPAVSSATASISVRTTEPG